MSSNDTPASEGDRPLIATAQSTVPTGEEIMRHIAGFCTDRRPEKLNLWTILVHSIKKRMASRIYPAIDVGQWLDTMGTDIWKDYVDQSSDCVASLVHELCQASAKLVMEDGRHLEAVERVEHAIDLTWLGLGQGYELFIRGAQSLWPTLDRLDLHLLGTIAQLFFRIQLQDAGWSPQPHEHWWVNANFFRIGLRFTDEGLRADCTDMAQQLRTIYPDFEPSFWVDCRSPLWRDALLNLSVEAYRAVIGRTSDTQGTEGQTLSRSPTSRRVS